MSTPPGNLGGKEDFEENAETLAWEKAYKGFQACREACIEAFTEAQGACQAIDNEKTWSKALWEEKASSLTQYLEKACAAHFQALDSLNEAFAKKASATTLRPEAPAEAH